jgi:glycogen debranching enzyme
LGISKRANNITEITTELHSGSSFTSALTLKEFKEHNNDFKVLELENKAKQHNHMKKLKLNISDRADMVNWMVEVISTFRCKAETFFRAVSIMDQFYARTKK